jgi:hypothetical protein
MLRSASCVLLLVTVAAGCASTPTDYQYSESKSSATSGCLKSGTRIKSEHGSCSASGRSSGDLSRSHATTAAGVLRGLDPSIIIRQ